MLWSLSICGEAVRSQLQIKFKESNKLLLLFCAGIISPLPTPF
ncbi:hypothetical protein GXM_01990 [Nostoc sphaeroides CCNUC1]|uniref:Uncharacterized protein n=1 Tax=Nostoc sphaeroides CCNUC1 TaxID=2653204 RepID=A0A5P8VVS9_9NOSO|nr:hypothetical protein GXM_01990 [Nostoc sphaeroides CCNUC1]